MKKILFISSIVIILFYYIIFPKTAMDASESGIMLWFYQIFPTLFPCTILSNILINSKVLDFDNKISKNTNVITEIIILICGMTFGFPIGSKLTSDFYSKKLINKKQAQTLMIVSNNISPAFISTYVLTNMLKLSNLRYQTYAFIYGPPVIYGCIAIFYIKKNINNSQKKSASTFQVNMKIVDAGIINGFSTLIKLCGYIVMFSLLVSIVDQLPLRNTYILTIITGVIETTNGIVTLTQTSLNIKIQYIIAVYFIAFGGISCIAQTGSIISETDLSIKKYVYAKLIMAFISTFLAAIYVLRFSSL